MDVDGLVNLNNSGTIKSLNAVGANSEGVTVGGGTIINSGTIEGDVASGNTSGALGRGITLAGIDSSGTPEPIYANSVITNTGLIRGQSDSAIAVDGGASGFTVTINNNAGGTLQGGGTSAAVRTGADNDTINNAGTIDGSASGKAIDMGGGNNALNITGGAASILGDISGGSGGTNSMTINPGAGNSFSYAGSISNFNSVQVQSGTVTLSGASTYTGATLVTGGRLILNGANRLASGSALTLSGGAVEFANAAGVNAQTLSSLSLLDNSELDLDSNAFITVNSLGTVTSGKTLSVLDFYAALNTTAIRFVGDQTANSSFLALLNGMTINGNPTAFQFDGTYTNIEATPIPGSLVLMLSGLGAMGGVARRRKQAA